MKIKDFVLGILLLLPGFIHCQSMDCPDDSSSIEFNIKKIPLFNERIYFMYHLLNDNRFEVSTESNNGIFVIQASSSFSTENGLEEAFEDFKMRNAWDYSQLDKQEAAMVAGNLKALLPEEYLLSLMMEVYESLRQNNFCETADPFCTDNGLYMFPAGVNAGSGEAGPYYDCLGSTPNPAWYYMKIDHPGDMHIYMYSTPSVDIDYCCWGPFDDPSDPCPNGLTSSKVVSCSYSPDPTETCEIPRSATTGDYYILLITNYSNKPCNINFSKTGGSGTTDCSILPPLVDNDGPACAGETIHLSANGPSMAVYDWSGPNGFTSGLQNPTIFNATSSMSGTYTCTITVGTASNYATTEVAVYDVPTANPGDDQTVNYGEVATLTASGDPNDYDYQWEPSDKVVSPNSPVTQTVNMTSAQTFTLTVTNRQGYCSTSNSTTVFVDGNAMTAVGEASSDEICAYDTIQLQVQAFDGTGEYTYSWTPAEYLSDSSIPNPIAYPKDNTIYVCHVSDGMTSIDINIPIAVRPALNPTIHGFNQVAVTSASLPGIYHYYVADTVGMESCDITWSCSNPNWMILPTNSDYQLTIVVMGAGEGTITVNTSCEFGCDTTYSLQVNATPYGIDEVENNPFQVYPNPASDYVTVRCAGMNRVRFYNNLGMMVRDVVLDDVEQTEINVSNLATGVYVTEIVSNGKRYYGKLIKK